jgi:hypothetical protein
MKKIIYFLLAILFVSCEPNKINELQSKLDEANKKIEELEQKISSSGTLTETSETIDGITVKKLSNSSGEITLVSIEDNGETVYLKPRGPNPNTINQLNCFISCSRDRRGCQDTKQNCDNRYSQCRSGCGATVFAKQ